MIAYNFYARFEEPIASGAKIGTVRARRKNGQLPKRNDLIRLYVGMRTKRCRLIREVVVRDVTPIIIKTTTEGAAVAGRVTTCQEVILGNENGAHRLSPNELLVFAKSEGFGSVREFAEFFHEKHGPNPDGLYHIRWGTDA